MVAMKDPSELPSNGGGAGAGGFGSRTEQGQIRQGRENSTGGKRRSQMGWNNYGVIQNGVGDQEEPAAPVTGPPLVTSPFVPTPVKGNFFNLGDPGGGGMGRGQRSPFLPTNNLLRMLEQMRMQKMNDLYYQPYLSAFGRRF